MTADKFLEIARSQVGVKETPVNQVKYNDWYYGKHVSGSSYPWCVVFVCWCANEAGVLGTLIPRTAGSSTMYKWFKKNSTITMNPKPGDIGFVKNTGSDKDKYPAEHTFIVYEVKGNSVVTIEGNIDNKVVKQTRKIDDKILGFGVVKWDTGFTRYVDYVDYEGLNVRFLSNGKKTGEVLQEATEVNVIEIENNRAHLSLTKYVDNHYLVDKLPAYKVVAGADREGLNVRPRYIGGIMGSPIATIKNGHRVKVYKVKGKWSKVSPDANAWCYSEYLK